MRRFVILLSMLPLIPIWALAQNAPAEVESEASEDVEFSASNPIRDQSGMIDKLVFMETPDAWQEGELTNARIDTDGEPAIVIDPPERVRYPLRATWVSAEVETEFPSTEFIPSWNVDVPEDTGVSFDMRVRMAESGEWSPWLYMGQWGQTLQSPRRVVTFDHGRVHVDILRLWQPADAFQLRATLLCWELEREATPRLRRLAMVYSGPEVGPQVEVSGGPPERWARDLQLPFRAQGWEDRAIRGSICSPTSVSMVMEHWGVSLPTVECAKAIYDPDYGIFGNWVRGTQFASLHGLDAWIDRFRDWDKVKATIAEGQPIIASIRFRAGTFPSNVMESTNGHLIVIRGITPEGDIIVNDPASSERGDGVVYKADELAQAWFNAGGIGYIIRPPANGSERLASR